MNCKKNIPFYAFYDTIRQLRGENGCPWDQKQTAVTLKKYIVEETTELLEAIDSEDAKHICEEAGDILFLITLLAEIHREKNQFSLDDVITGITAKMIRRHPHVFGDTTIRNEKELKAQWEEIKAQEQAKKRN